MHCGATPYPAIALEQVQGCLGATTESTPHVTLLLGAINSTPSVRQFGPGFKAGEAISDQPIVRILVVDDFADWRCWVCEKLQENRRLQVIGVASDGREAVLKAEGLRPDLILLDIGLPKLDGIQAARRIRELSPDSKILFVSVESSVEVVDEALGLGAHGYLSKYDVASDFLLAVDTVLQGMQFVSRSSVMRPVKPDSSRPADAPCTERTMNWEITGDKVVYTCSNCNWKLEIVVDRTAEPRRGFDQHICEDHLSDKPLGSGPTA